MKTTIRIETIIHAPIQRCFDLSRSIDVHQISTEGSNEKAIGGRTSGLIEAGETVTWEATHFFVRQRLTTKIITMNPPFRFYDMMLSGAFKSMDHDHIFDFRDGHTTVIDVLNYETPYGIFGRIFDVLVLRRYMTDLLVKRNAVIKKAAESLMWKEFL